LIPANENTATIVSLKTACAMTSLSRSAINVARGKGAFPAAVSLGEKRIGFVRGEVQAWIDARIAARSANDNGQQVAA